ncbi:MAG: hypothetical protein MSA15_21370 [Clostridium sp.]|nr:hypothetical protein [Clostridium sp.]
MVEKLYANRKEATYHTKYMQQEELFQKVLKMLVFEGNKLGEVDGEKEMFDAINRLDIEMFLGVKEGQHGACLRPDCNFLSHANFFKATDSQIWLYSCPCCQAGAETITFSELVVELFKAKYPSCNHRTIVRLIRKAFNLDFVSDFYAETEQRLNYNMQKLREVDKKSELGKLIKSRRLEEFLEDYNEIAITYATEGEKYNYSFYASRSIILEYFKDIKKQAKGNSIMEKLNLMAELGFITRLQSDEIPSVLKRKIKYRKDKEEYWIKDVSVYQVNRITDEQLAQAEVYAKAIRSNKIYRNKVSLDESIKETCSFTKKEISFLNRANKDINKELDEKGYIALSSVISKIDKKCRFYKRQEKEQLYNLLEDRILLEANVKKIKATETNKKKYNMKRVVDRETILIKSDKVVEISERIVVEESVREAKKQKSEEAKKKLSKSNKVKPRKNKKQSKEPVVVKTYIDSYGNTNVVYEDGSEDTIDIPF